MVGGQDEQHGRLVGLRQRIERRQRNRRCRVAPAGLQQDAGLRGCARELFRDEEAMCLAADDDAVIREARQAIEPGNRLLQHRPVGDQR